MKTRFTVSYSNMRANVYKNYEDFKEDFEQAGFTMSNNEDEAFFIIDGDANLRKEDNVNFDNLLKFEDSFRVGAVYMFPMQNIKEYFLISQ